MISLTSWARIIVKDLHYPGTIVGVSNTIKRNCLLGRTKVYGAYQVDQQKIWDTLIVPCHQCRESLEKIRVNNVIEMESWQTEREYQAMHLSARSAFKKVKR